MHDRSQAPVPRPARGFSLIEVLIALLVLAVGLLGLAFLQAAGLRFNNDSYMRSQATLLAYDLVDRMRANRKAAMAGAYCLTSLTPCETTAPPAAENCADILGCGTPAQLGHYDVSQWYQLQEKRLAPAATPSSFTGAVIPTASAAGSVFRVTITMRWKERENNISQQWVIDL